ncbi:hypothetical protein ACT691_02335 [Vibrio metschnikovii]
MGFVDTVMAGGVRCDRYGCGVHCSGVFGCLLSYLVSAYLMALVPIVAQLNGSGRKEQIAFEIQQGAILALWVHRYRSFWSYFKPKSFWALWTLKS